jgi:hypothetical protein
MQRPGANAGSAFASLRTASPPDAATFAAAPDFLRE